MGDRSQEGRMVKKVDDGWMIKKGQRKTGEKTKGWMSGLARLTLTPTLCSVSLHRLAYSYNNKEKNVV